MKNRARSISIWAGLLGSALALALLAATLIHREERRRLQADQKLLETESVRLESRLKDYFSEIQNETSKQLIAFHEEGLANQLRRWKTANTLVSSAQTQAPSAETDALFDQTALLVHLDQPDTSSELRSGYYSENRDLAAYEGRSVDPVIAWSQRKANGVTRWIVAHRIGPQSPVRYAELDNAALADAFSNLVSEFSGPGLVARIDRRSDSASSAAEVPLDAFLPETVLRLDIVTPVSGGVWLTRFGYAMVALCFALGVVCAILLSRQAARERREAMRKASFVSQISHEFKTPLTSIGLYADLLCSDELSLQKRVRYLDTISRESQRLTDLVDNLLALSALEQGKKRYRIADVDLVDFLSQLVADYSPILAKAGMVLRWQPSLAEAPALVDSAALRQAMINLFDNARKYAASGGDVRVELARSRLGWEIGVADHGPGIPNRLRERVFETFFQEKALLANKSPGAGLGLSISRRLLRDCKGDLSLDLNYAEGARFLLRLPVSETASLPPVPQS